MFPFKEFGYKVNLEKNKAILRIKLENVSFYILFKIFTTKRLSFLSNI